VGVAALAAEGGARGALLNVKINLKSMKDDSYKGDMLTSVKEIEDKTKSLFEEVNGIVSFKLLN
jgi:formiminotetrahydrofolate cyclodeaminase